METLKKIFSNSYVQAITGFIIAFAIGLLLVKLFEQQVFEHFFVN